MRNGQSRIVTEERLIEAAVYLFSCHGFKGSSTREIARRAGVNEVTLFRHFPRKKDLFWAAAESQLRGLQIAPELLIALESDADPRAVLPMIIELLTNASVRESGSMRLLYLSLGEPGAEEIIRRHLIPVLQPIRNYLQRCVDSHSLRDVDPGVAAASMLVTIFLHPIFSSIVLDGDESASREQLRTAYSNFWLKVLCGSDVCF